jgi:hypothetical protein
LGQKTTKSKCQKYAQKGYAAEERGINFVFWMNAFGGLGNVGKSLNLRNVGKKYDLRNVGKSLDLKNVVRIYRVLSFNGNNLGNFVSRKRKWKKRQKILQKGDENLA